MNDVITISDDCIKKVKELMDEESTPGLKLRIFVQGGGCSGFSYGFTFEENISEDDTVVIKDGVYFLIDTMSYQYLVGSYIDYTDDFNGSQFMIKNPNSSSTCGCGSSFSID